MGWIGRVATWSRCIVIEKVIAVSTDDGDALGDFVFPILQARHDRDTFEGASDEQGRWRTVPIQNSIQHSQAFFQTRAEIKGRRRIGLLEAPRKVRAQKGARLPIVPCGLPLEDRRLSDWQGILYGESRNLNS